MNANSLSGNILSYSAEASGCGNLARGLLAFFRGMHPASAVTDTNREPDGGI